jgi:hypothetical protein
MTCIHQEENVVQIYYHRGRDDDDEGNGDCGHPRPRGFMNRVSSWMDGKGKIKDPQLDRGHNRS